MPVINYLNEQCWCLSPDSLRVNIFYNHPADLFQVILTVLFFGSQYNISFIIS